MSHRKKLALSIAAIVAGIALAALGGAGTAGAAQNPAPGSQNPCPDCVTHNSQPGDGTGGFTFEHTCVADPNSADALPQFVGTFHNPTGSEVRGTIVPWAVGVDGVTPVRQLQTPTGFTAPPHGTTTVTIRLPAATNHVRFLVWKSTAKNGHFTESFDCPCPVTPPTSSPETTVPDTTIPPGSVPPSSGPPVVTSPPSVTTGTTLPATGVATDTTVGVGVALVAAGILALSVATWRDRRHARLGR